MTKDKTNIEEIKETKRMLNELGCNGDYGEYEEFLIKVVSRTLNIWNDKEMPSGLKDDCLNETQMEFEEDFAELFVVMAKKLGYTPKDQVRAEKEFFLHYTELTESEFDTRFEQFKKEQREYE